MTFNKLIPFLLSLMILVASLVPSASVFADDVGWHYDSVSDTLYITGSGNMDDYANTNLTPWAAHVSHMQSVVVEEGVTSIGKNAFAGAQALQRIQLAESVTSLGENCLASCPLLLSLQLSSNVISITDISFAYNGNAEKQGFVLSVTAGSYALSFAYKNDLNFICEDVRTGTLHVSLQKGMMAYFPYTCRYTGQYKFYSVSKHDPLGYIYDSTKTQIAYNDDHGSGYPSGQGSTDFGITTTLTQGERYYLAVKIFNPSMTARFDVFFEPVQFTVSGSVYAMNAPDGTPSDILLTQATVNGEATNNGSFTRTVNGLSETVTVACGGVSKEVTLTVDDNGISIPLMMCDINNDSIVNAKDYALMLQTDSPYMTLYENFMNYQY